MNAILGFSQLLNDDETTNEEKKEFSNLILDRGEDLLKVLNDLLDYSKLVAYDIKLNFEYIDAGNLVDEVANYGNKLLKKKKEQELRTVCKTQQETPEKNLYTDSLRVTQILNHLMDNAVKFSDKGDIDVGCYLESNVEGEFVIFFVQDRGIGIKEELKSVIFDGFRQADESFSRRYDGTGIGLSFSKPMATMLGGRLWFESMVDVGSTFYLSIPVNIKVRPTNFVL